LPKYGSGFYRKDQPSRSTLLVKSCLSIKKPLWVAVWRWSQIRVWAVTAPCMICS